VPRVIAAAAAGARAAVLKTPSQLQILRDAGVVDAGGYGLQLILEGMLKSMEESEPAPSSIAETRRPASPASQVSLDLPEGGWGGAAWSRSSRAWAWTRSSKAARR